MLELICCPRCGTFSRIPFHYTFNDQKCQRTNQAYSLLARFGVDHKEFKINLSRDLHLHWNNADCNKQRYKPNHHASDSAIRKHTMSHCSRNDGHKDKLGGKHEALTMETCHLILSSIVLESTWRPIRKRWLVTKEQSAFPTR